VEVTSTEVGVNGSEAPAQTVTSAIVDIKSAPMFKHTSYPAAWTAAQESNRPILVYVSMPQCPHCTKMLEQTYESNGVNEIVKGSFETLQVSRYTHASLVSKLHVRWYPSTVLVSSNNKVLDMIEGYVDANTFKQRLQLGLASANSDTQTR
jgi:thioredoxin-related protein